MRGYSKANFANATIHERIVLAWLQERDNRWVSQHIWGHSLMDNWHPTHRVCIEVDGPDHQKKFRKEKDRRRDDSMSASNIKVLRVTNNEVDTGEAFCKMSELMGYEWRHEDFYRPIWKSPYE